MPRPTTTLWRPTGPAELALVAESGWRAWPPRLPDQPIFYPVLNEDYAIRIARDWNVPASGSGYVTRFRVDSAFLGRYPVRQAGGRTILELWVPAEELAEFNTHIVGVIEVVHEFHGDGTDGRFSTDGVGSTDGTDSTDGTGITDGTGPASGVTAD